MPDDLLDDLMPLADAAERIGVHPATVRAFVHDNRLRGYRRGAHWYIRKTDLEQFLRIYQRPKNQPRHQGTGLVANQWIELVLKWLLEWHSANANELALVIDLHPGNLRKYTNQAEETGLVYHDDDRTWYLTEAGRQRAGRLPPAEHQATTTSE